MYWISIMELDDDDRMEEESDQEKPGHTAKAVARVAEVKDDDRVIAADEKNEQQQKAETKVSGMNVKAYESMKQQHQQDVIFADVHPIHARNARENILSDDLVELANTWSPLNSQFSQTKPLPYQMNLKASEYWQSQIANDASDMFKVLMPKKILLGLCNQLNQHLRRLLGGKISEQELKRKFYKPEQMYEYFGVKILMGYCKMADASDYFNTTLPYRTRIGDLIKEGRFKAIEQFANFNDDMLLALKMHRQTKAEYKERLHYDEEVIPYIMKKINKIQRRCCNSTQSLSVIRSSFFEAKDPRSNEALTCVYMQDATSQFIVHMGFQIGNFQDNCIMRMLEAFKHRNHKVYLQRNMLSLEQINHLAVVNGVYCHSVVKNPSHAEIKFTRGELMANGTLMVLMLKQKDPTNIMVSSADGFHRFSSSDKRSFATVTLQENLKKAEMYPTLSDQYRCQFSCVNLSGTLFTEVLELITWNTYIAYKTLLKKNPTVEFGEFRVLLAKQLLASKIKSLDHAPTSSNIVKTVSVAIQTEKPSALVQHAPKAPISSFHIPTVLVSPAALSMNLVCVVCRKPHTQLCQCSNCSEVSGKLVALCPTECFSTFHQQAHLYISNAQDLQTIPKEPSRNPVHQFESSTLAQSAAYTQSLQNKYGPPPMTKPPQPYQPYNPYQPTYPPQQQQPPYPPTYPPPAPYYYGNYPAYPQPPPQQMYPTPTVPQQQPYTQPYEDNSFYHDDEVEPQPRKKPGRPAGGGNKQKKVSIQEPPPQHEGGRYYDTPLPLDPQGAPGSSKYQRQIQYSYVTPQDDELE